MRKPRRPASTLRRTCERAKAGQKLWRTISSTTRMSGSAERGHRRASPSNSIRLLWTQVKEKQPSTTNSRVMLERPFSQEHSSASQLRDTTCPSWTRRTKDKFMKLKTSRPWISSQHSSRTLRKFCRCWCQINYRPLECSSATWTI